MGEMYYRRSIMVTWYVMIAPMTNETNMTNGKIQWRQMMATNATVVMVVFSVVGNRLPGVE